MKKITLIILLFSTLLCNNNLWAQYVLKEADANYVLNNYSKAIPLYEQAYKKKPTLYAVEKLADCYKKQNNYKQAESWYAIAVTMPGSKIENTFYYAEALQDNSKYAEAKIQYLKFADQNPAVNQQQKEIWLASCDSAMKWMKEPKPIVVINEKKLNSEQSDWGIALYNKNLVFASDRLTENETNAGKSKPFLKLDLVKLPDEKITAQTGHPYFKLYIYDGPATVKPFNFNAGTQYHVGPASFTSDGKELYFALTKVQKIANYTRIKPVAGKIGTINVEIFSSKLNSDGTWSTAQAFKYNNVDEYSVSDPFISRDGKTLYFSANMPGGKGGTDLYLCKKTDSGDWGQPINLAEINTAGNERTPYLDAQNNFYFSSDGRVGMGGLDIYKCELSAGKMGIPQNLYYPINSAQDDFAFIKTTDNTGYFSSNRAGGIGDDDIYSFSPFNDVEQHIAPFKLVGTVYNKKTNEPLSNALVSLSLANGNTLKVQTGNVGEFSFNVNQVGTYSLLAEKTNFRNDIANLDIKDLPTSGQLKKDLYLEFIELNKAIRLDNIYYDFDKSNIRADAAVELNKLVKFLNDNPTVWIDIASHTDSHGSELYNMQLSERRANYVLQYLLKMGINKNRITSKGYGKTRLLVKPENGRKTTKEEDQLNRRTEFSIVKQ